MRQLTAAACILSLTYLIPCFIGCAESSRKAPAPTQETEAAKESNPATTDATSSPAGAIGQSDIKVDLASFDQLRQRIASFKDRVVVVDAWSTSCLPCMKEFPHLVELARRWPEDVVCISINLDFAGLPDTTPQTCLPAVTKFLQAKAADPANLVHLLSTDTDEQMYGKLEIESIPSIFVYDRSGALASKLTVDTAGADGLTYAGDVVPLVEKLIEAR